MPTKQPPSAVRVVDTSAVAALLFSEPRADEVVDRLSGGELVAPNLFRYELASVCLKKLATYPEQRAGLLEAWKMVEMLGIQEVDVPMHQELVELAESCRLTAYDASYLWLARSLQAELVTLDVKLGRAASPRGT
jgi:predicted nucleic acid-binding protein